MAAVIDTSAASFFAWMGCASALVFANLGAAYGTARSGVGLCSMGVMSPGLVMKNIIPIVMAGILGIYGLIVAVIIQGGGEFLITVFQRFFLCLGSCSFSSLVFLTFALFFFFLSSIMPPFPPPPLFHLRFVLPIAAQIPAMTNYNEAMNQGYKLFAAGLCCGLSCLAAGFAIGITGDAGVRAVGQQNLMYVGVILVLIFGEALGLFGLIVALVLAQ